MADTNDNRGQNQGQVNNPGNFANDPEKAREAGRKGGESSHSGGNPGGSNK